MKLRTRKFLAGLLSLGLLLQAASPLSALAAETSSGEPTLTIESCGKTITVDSTTESFELPYTVTIFNGSPVPTTEERTEKITVQLSGDTYTLTGRFPKEATITGNGNPNLDMEPGTPPDQYSTDIAKDTLTVSGITNFTANSNNKAFHELSINCAGDIDITAQASICEDGLIVTNANNVNIKGYLTQKNENRMFGSVNINCKGDVELRRETSGRGMVAGSTYITTPKKVTLYAASSKSLSNGEYAGNAVITAGEFIADNPTNVFTSFVFKKYEGDKRTYQVVACKSEEQANATPVDGITAEADSYTPSDMNSSYYWSSYGYLHIYPGEYEEYGITLDSVKVTSLNKDGFQFANAAFTYAPTTKTLSTEDQVNSSRSYDSFTITGNGETKLVLKQGSANELTVKKVASIDAEGAFGDRLTVEDCTGAVKVVGSSDSVLIGAGSRYTSEISSSSLLLENTGSGKIGKVKFTKPDSSKTYLVTTGASSTDPACETKELAGDSYTLTADSNIAYLYIREDVPPADEMLTVKVDGTTYNINSYSTVIGNTGVKVEYDSTSKTYTLTGAFAEDAEVEITGVKTPNLELNLTGKAGSLTLNALGDVNITGSASPALTENGLTVKAESLTVENTGKVGKVEFTPSVSGDYNVVTGSSKLNPDGDPEPLDGTYQNADLDKGYLSITTGKVYAAPQLIVTVGGTEYTLNPASTTLNGQLTVSYEDGVYTLAGQIDDDVVVEGKAYRGQLPGVKWVQKSGWNKSYSVKSLAVENVDGFQWDSLGTRDSLTLEDCGDVNITAHGSASSGDTTITNAGSVKITAEHYGQSIGGYDGTVTIDCTGNVELTNELGGLTYNALTVKTNGDVTLNTNSSSKVAGSMNVTAHKLIVDNKGGAPVGNVTFNGAKEDYIACISKKYVDRTIEIPNNTDVKSHYLYVGPEGEYVAVPVNEPTLTIKVGEETYIVDSETTKIENTDISVKYGNGEYILTGGFTGDVEITGNDYNGKKPSVTMENENDKVVSGSLKVSGVEDFEAAGSGIVGGDLNVTTSGKVALDAKNGSIVGENNKLDVETSGSVSLTGSGTNSSLIPEGAAASVKAGKMTTKNEDGTIGTITFTPAGSGDYLVNGEKAELSEDGTITVSDANISREDGYTDLTVEPDTTNIPDDDDFSGGGSSAGGAVAAVIVGGAAVWGGYEVATRVILHNILPEGAEIPANRGQLALLVWNTAGRPEPANTPAFVDVADADTAKAAQWCVEQGLMDAKSESTFKPEGWMPKFKTIEVWEKAFPKQ